MPITPNCLVKPSCRSNVYSIIKDNQFDINAKTVKLVSVEKGNMEARNGVTTLQQKGATDLSLG